MPSWPWGGSLVPFHRLLGRPPMSDDTSRVDPMNKGSLLRTVMPVQNGRHQGPSYPATEGRAWAEQTCPHCTAVQLLVVCLTIKDENANMPTVQEGGPAWYLCTNCRRPSVLDHGVVKPETRPLRTPRGLPPTDMVIWDEVRSCLGVYAYSATVMLCRKLLLHIAVDKGLPAKNSRNRAPSYLDAVKHLESAGVITADMREWVEEIKDIGNDANHELTPITDIQATDVATFTEQLLVLAYEMRALRVGKERPPVDDTAPLQLDDTIE